MIPASTWTRLHGKYQRGTATRLFRRPFRISSDAPVISFTFDDFPRSALHTGGAILQRHGLAGTYYGAFGLMGTSIATGDIFVREDLASLFAQGHELGCHTFSHCDAWRTETASFARSLEENRRSLAALVPGYEFKSFSYPISPPRGATKRLAGTLFETCRGGGQMVNHGIVDLNYLASFFLEKSRDRIRDVKKAIDDNQELRGWLIFSTHDVDSNPTSYGCTAEFFDEVVHYSVDSGARILTVRDAMSFLRTKELATS